MVTDRIEIVHERRCTISTPHMRQLGLREYRHTHFEARPKHFWYKLLRPP